MMFELMFELSTGLKLMNCLIVIEYLTITAVLISVSTSENITLAFLCKRPQNVWQNSLISTSFGIKNDEMET